MDTNYQSNDSSQLKEEKVRSLATASMVLGIISVVLCCMGFLGIPFGALGLILALMTRQSGRRMSGMAMAGVWLSCVGIALGVLITASAVYTILSDPSAYMDTLNAMYEQFYGMSMEEYYQYYLQ